MQDIKPSTYKAPKTRFGFYSFVFILAALVLAGFLFKDDFRAKIFPAPMKEGVYSAVFLSNEQVYFGKILSNTALEMKLVDVYYLQTAKTDATEPTFSLVKLGNELHGPTDELFINKSQVLFYEELRPDGRVMQSIMNNKNIINNQ